MRPKVIVEVEVAWTDTIEEAVASVRRALETQDLCSPTQRLSEDHGDWSHAGKGGCLRIVAARTVNA